MGLDSRVTRYSHPGERRQLRHYLFEVGVGPFIGIAFRAVTGQVEHLNVLNVFGQPLFKRFAVMHTQVVQDQQHFLLLSLDQSLEEVDQDRRVQRPIQDAPAHLPLVGKRRDDRQSLAMSI